MTRIEKIRSGILGKGDAILITSDSNRFYASGFASSAGFMLISQNEAVLYLDFRYCEMAKLAKEKGELQNGIEVVLAEKKRKEYICDFVKRCGVKTLLFEDGNLTYSEYISLKNETAGACEIKSAGDIIESCRAVKDESEIERIKKAQSITDKAFSHILGYITPNVTEMDIALELEFFMRKNGAEDVAFDTICVSGAKSSLPHGRPENVKLGKGFLTMDFGAKYEGYCADMTRTVCIGNPTPEMKKVYDTVLEAQNRAFSEIFAGTLGNRVDSAARDYIYSSGYRGCFGHSLGHSLGIDVHESPNFSPNYCIEIPENAVLSVEPGIYIEGQFGVRIEDIVKISAFGFENLTESTKELIII